jgi:hypothetical protein
MGRPREAFLPGLRALRHRGYVILHLIGTDDEGAEAPVIVAVIHERRNLAALDFADRIEGERRGPGRPRRPYRGSAIRPFTIATQPSSSTMVKGKPVLTAIA